MYYDGGGTGVFQIRIALTKEKGLANLEKIGVYLFQYFVMLRMQLIYVFFFLNSQFLIHVFIGDIHSRDQRGRLGIASRGVGNLATSRKSCDSSQILQQVARLATRRKSRDKSQIS